MSVDPRQWREQVVGVEKMVPVLGGGRAPYVNFDNAASTPALKPVLDAVNRFAEWYSSVHRGTGFKSKLSTFAYEAAREKVLRFVGADPRTRVAVFTRNTTEAVNKLAWRLNLDRDDVIITTLMEHHSNDLPWRRVAGVVRLALDADGSTNFDRLEDLLRQHKGRVRLVAVTGASNVTGLVTPIYDVAQLAHRYGAQIFVDAAQLAPHRRISLEGDGRPDTHIDYLAFSAHKMYAPFGSGALVGWRQTFGKGEPLEVGGGTIRIVTLDRVVYADAPDSEEAGSPNVIGAVALGAAIDWFLETGIDRIEAYESELARAAWHELQRVPGVRLYGPGRLEDGPDRLAVFTFNLDGWHHAKLAAVLGYEFGIGVRNGCFCAHPYVKVLMNIGPEQEKALIRQVSQDDRSDVPGAVRISFGFYNTIDEIRYFSRVLNDLASGAHAPREYRLITSTGEYVPVDGEFDYPSFL